MKRKGQSEVTAFGVRARGRQRMIPRYDREAVSNPSQTLSVSEGERPTTPAQCGLARRGETDHVLPMHRRRDERRPRRGQPTPMRIGLAWVGSPLRARPHWAGVVGLSPPGEAASGWRGWALPSGRGRIGLAWVVSPLRARPHRAGVGGLSPSLTLRVWLGLLTASRSYRGTTRPRPQSRRALPQSPASRATSSPISTTEAPRAAASSSSADTAVMGAKP